MIRQVLIVQFVGIVLGQEWVWKQGRATFYGQHSTIHKGSCGFGQICPHSGTGWDVAAISEAHWAYDNSCGRCYEVQCRSAQFTDGFGEQIDRSAEDICFQQDASVVVTIVDTCPCNAENKYYSNARWCCGDMEHLGLSVYAFEKLADKQHGVIGISYREVPCDYQPHNTAQQIKNPTQANYDFDQNKCNQKQQMHGSEETFVQDDSKNLEQNQLVNAQQNLDQWTLQLDTNFNLSPNSQKFNTENNQNNVQNAYNAQNQEQIVLQQNISDSQHDQNGQISENFDIQNAYNAYNVQNYDIQYAYNAYNVQNYDIQNAYNVYNVQNYTKEDDQNQKYDQQNVQNMQYQHNVYQIDTTQDLNIDTMKLDYYTKLNNQMDTNMLKSQQIVISNLDSSLTQNQTIYNNFHQQNNWWVLSSKSYFQRKNGESMNQSGTSLCGEIKPGGFVEFVGRDGAFYAQSALQIWIKQYKNTNQIQSYLNEYENSDQDENFVPDLDLNIGSMLNMCAPFRLVDIKPEKYDVNSGYAKLNINLGIFDVPRTNTQNYVFKECNGILASSINTLKFTNSKMVAQTVCFDQIKLISNI